jgi:hypothetical protein
VETNWQNTQKMDNKVGALKKRMRLIGNTPMIASTIQRL